MNFQAACSARILVPQYTYIALLPFLIRSSRDVFPQSVGDASVNVDEGLQVMVYSLFSENVIPLKESDKSAVLRKTEMSI